MVSLRHQSGQRFFILYFQVISIFFFCKKHIFPVMYKVRNGKRNGGGEAAWSPGSNRSAGVAVLVHPQSTAKLADFRTDLSGRVVTVKIDLDGKFFQVINVYAPNNHSDRKEFFDSLWCFSFHNIESIIAVILYFLPSFLHLILYFVILTLQLHLNCIRVIIYFPLSYLHLIVNLL